MSRRSPPLCLRRPDMRGAGQVGTRLTADPGSWEGADWLDLVWLRDGIPLTHQDVDGLALTDDDDGCVYSVSVTAIGPGGTTTVASAGCAVSCAPPAATGAVLDDVLDAESGWQVLPTAAAFTGAALRYSAKGAGAVIDPRTGVLEVPTGPGREGGEITVSAANSAGRARAVLRVTVEGQPTSSQRRALDVDGVTFFFDSDAPTGHFISGAAGAGDPWVIGPVTLRGYDPAPGTLPGGRVVNGAMLNPPCTRASGFDSITDVYDPDVNAALRLPLRLVPGDRLVVAISNPEAEGRRDASRRFVVLTCLDRPPPRDAFRPPYSGPLRMYRFSDVDTRRLAALMPLGRGLDLAELESRFDRFTLEINRDWNRQHLEAPGHPPLYGRDVCNDEGAPLVLVNCNVPATMKTRLLIGLIQRGIDRFGVLESAKSQDFHPWFADGAHHNGRKFSIMFAGHLLDVDPMRRVARYSRSEPGAGSFHEDYMTDYVTQARIDATNGPDWAPPYGDRQPRQPYSQAMLGMPDWNSRREPHRANAAWTGNPYRIAGNHNAQHGQVLASLAMGLREAWDHDAFFDYHMRHMDIMDGRPDPWRFKGGRQALFDPVIGSRPEGGSWDGWLRYWRCEWCHQMLRHHRAALYRFPWQ